MDAIDAIEEDSVFEGEGGQNETLADAVDANGGAVDKGGQRKCDSTGEASGDAAEDGFGFGHVLKDYVRTLPHTGCRYLEARRVFVVEGLDRPIGICALPSGSVAVSSSGGEGSVKLYDDAGQLRGHVEPGRPFSRPTDMVALPDGRFAVRDNRVSQHGNFSARKQCIFSGNSALRRGGLLSARRRRRPSALLHWPGRGRLRPLADRRRGQGQEGGGQN